MSKADPTEQVKFLVTCIAYTSNGRPDFQQVANELGIVTKAAAQKRYERMLKAHGINGIKANGAASATQDDKVTPSPPAKKRKAPATPARGRKKRTTMKDESDDEDAKPLKKSVKKEEDAASNSTLSDPPSSEAGSVKDEE